MSESKPTSTRRTPCSVRRNAPRRCAISRPVQGDGLACLRADYGGGRLDVEAQVAGRSLLMDGIPYSMSEAAKLGLQKHGYISDSVRGPAHWYTTDGKSVRELWGKHLIAGS